MTWPAAADVHLTLGKLVCRAGDEADAFYIVADGRARRG